MYTLSGLAGRYVGVALYIARKTTPIIIIMVSPVILSLTGHYMYMGVAFCNERKTTPILQHVICYRKPHPHSGQPVREDLADKTV